MSGGVYAAFIEGQGGILTSAGMARMAHVASLVGIASDVFAYEQLLPAQTAALAHHNNHEKVALIAFSAGVGTAGALSRLFAFDLIIGLDPSRDCINYKLNPATRRSILFHNRNWLSQFTGIGAAGEAGDPGGDLGFQIRREIDENHLAVDLDPNIQSIVQQELLRLKQET